MGNAAPGIAIEDLNDSEQRLYDFARQPMPLAEVAVRLGVPIGEADRRIAALLSRLALPDRAALRLTDNASCSGAVKERASSEAADRPSTIGAHVQGEGRIFAAAGWLALTIGLAAAAAYLSWA